MNSNKNVNYVYKKFRIFQIFYKKKISVLTLANQATVEGNFASGLIKAGGPPPSRTGAGDGFLPLDPLLPHFPLRGGSALSNLLLLSPTPHIECKKLSLIFSYAFIFTLHLSLGGIGVFAFIIEKRDCFFETKYNFLCEYRQCMMYLMYHPIRCFFFLAFLI